MLKWSNMQIRICYFITKGNWGGAQKYIFDLATSLPKEGFDPFVICGQGNTLKEKLEKAGIRVYELKKLKRDFSFFSAVSLGIAVLQILWKEKPQIIHLNSPKAAGIGAVAGRILGIKKIIMTVHGWSGNEDRSFLWRWMAWLFSNVTAILCHKIIVISEKEIKQALKMMFVSNKKTILIKNGVKKIDFKEKDVARKDLLFRMGKIDVGDVLWIGTISELHKNKGLEYAIYAMAEIRTPFVFFIIGEGEERKSLEKLTAEKNLKDKVFLVGFLDNANQYLKAFDVFTLTSIKEGLPYSILEAGLAGVPVIASDVGGIPDIIENGVSGKLVTKANPREIKQALEYLINIKDQRKILGENLKEKVERKFSFEEMITKTLGLYS